jgi:hypothetical protein
LVIREMIKRRKRNASESVTHVQPGLDTSWLSPGSVRAAFWLALFRLGSGWLVVVASWKNGLGSGYAEAR